MSPIDTRYAPSHRGYDFGVPVRVVELPASGTADDAASGGTGGGGCSGRSGGSGAGVGTGIAVAGGGPATDVVAEKADAKGPPQSATPAGGGPRRTGFMNFLLQQSSNSTSASPAADGA